ncbi:hypothetical protein CEXT_504191 [Caerostris extrusa]|uniref:Uncharacterized protein n=1 Tax=Caerostris extrusa TaxID=172846 RepID=A0AAV4NYU3_CAEEX|nr:hypothetical protein CEXT_504191 [Caerostris extrusa]
MLRCPVTVSLKLKRSDVDMQLETETDRGTSPALPSDSRRHGSDDIKTFEKGRRNRSFDKKRSAKGASLEWKRLDADMQLETETDRGTSPALPSDSPEARKRRHQKRSKGGEEIDHSTKRCAKGGQETNPYKLPKMRRGERI